MNTLETVDFKLPAEWTDDCQGKKDFDGDLVSLSTRYWPAGGGMWIFEPGRGMNTNPHPEIRPSAKSSILLNYSGDYVIFAEQEFEADTQAQVQDLVEAWAKEQYQRVIAALTKEFGEWKIP